MKNKSKILICAATIVAVIAISAVAVKSYLFARYDGKNAVRVEIPAFSDKAAVDSIIKNSLGGSYGRKVARLWNALSKDALRSHGSYLVQLGDEAVRVAKRIAEGRQTPVRFTFNNLRRFEDLAGRAGRMLEVDSLTFLETADSILSAEGFSPANYSAALLPDTYEFYWTSPADVIIEKMSAHRKKFWNDERRKKAAKLGLSPEEVHTLASIVEEESNKSDERPVIARLYLNRLGKNMFLQADPTVKFASGDFAARRVTHDMTLSDSPYNTYKHRGLPPGPIRIVEAATLDAVLDAPENNYLYMCAKPDFSGYHNFTNDYRRHTINAVLYHRALNNRGIK